MAAFSRDKEKLDKLYKSGLIIPASFKEHRKNWSSWTHGLCDLCGRDNRSLYEYWEDGLCYNCYLTNWKNWYEYDMELLTSGMASDMFDAFRKEEKEKEAVFKPIGKKCEVCGIRTTMYFETYIGKMFVHKKCTIWKGGENERKRKEGHTDI